MTRRDQDSVAVLTLCRPHIRNPLSEALITAISLELDAIAADRSIKAVVIEAEGPVFCAGHDLKEMTARRSDPDRGRVYFAALMQRCAAMMQKIVALPQPVIAAVEGVATAAGCQLVATCDLAVAGAGARFATPGVHIGLFCSTPMVALSRSVSNKHAMEMLLLGDLIDAQTAKTIGLVNRVRAEGGALAEALAIGRIIASKSALTVKTGKQAFYRQREMGLEEAYTYACNVMVENMMARDAEEGIAAFVEKREPAWESW